MKSWLKDNWFKGLIALLLILLSGDYLLSKSDEIVQTESRESLISLREKCRSAGVNAHNLIIAEFESSSLSYTMMKPEYTYSDSLDKCLYSSGTVTEGNALQVNRWVKDSLTNQEILSFTSMNGEPFGSMTEEEFERQKALLFN